MVAPKPNEEKAKYHASHKEASELLKKSYRGGFFKLKVFHVVFFSVSFPILYSLFEFDLKKWDLWRVYISTLILSIVLYLLVIKLIPKFKDKLIAANLSGKDLLKPYIPFKIPESGGVVSASCFIVAGIITQLFASHSESTIVKYNGALLSICLMIMLGFADDVFNLRWRIKLVFPFVATFPLVVSYNGLTSVVLPIQLRELFGSSYIDLGILYIIYMMLFAIFCTNSINIHAGVNGLEVGQSIIIACAVFLHNCIEIKLNKSTTEYNSHLFSLTIILPFIFSSIGLMKFNKYPAQIFVGDTYTYFSGMTLAVVGILSHCTKTLLLFFIPQIINFLLSFPQMMGFIKCPRHRMPKINEKTMKLYVVHRHFTLINAFLRLFGDTNEDQTCMAMLFFQVICCAFGFFVRYFVANYFF